LPEKEGIFGNNRLVNFEIYLDEEEKIAYNVGSYGYFYTGKDF